MDEKINYVFQYDFYHCNIAYRAFMAENEGNNLMGYCDSSRWMSSYHYAKMAQWIQRTQSW